MIKNSLAFLAGMVLVTGIVISAGGRPAAFVGLGFLLACSLASGVLWLTGVRRLLRFLDAVLASSEDRPSRRAGTVRQAAPVDKSGYRKPSRKRQIQDVADTIEEYKERHVNDVRYREVSPITQAVLSDSDLFGGRVQ